jgi:hypothetical protein
MSAIDQNLVSKILNSTTPGSAGSPASWTALNSGVMTLKLTSTASSSSSSGTEIANGNGYTTNGKNIFGLLSSGGSAVTVPHGGSAPLQWVCALSGGWTIYSLEIIDAAQLRAWFGNWTGAPISVANANTFQVAADAVSIALS